MRTKTNPCETQPQTGKARSSRDELPSELVGGSTKQQGQQNTHTLSQEDNANDETNPNRNKSTNTIQSKDYNTNGGG